MVILTVLEGVRLELDVVLENLNVLWMGRWRVSAR